MSQRARKIAVVGARSVGKSSLTVQYVENHFVESYYPTIENQFSKTVKVNNKEYAIEILDTAGQDEFSIMNQKYLIGVHGYVFVYSIASKSSFETLRVIRDKILNSAGTDNIPMIIVGNKKDLSSMRQVSSEEGAAMASEFKCRFIECSAKGNDGVDKAFEVLVDEIERIQNPSSSSKGCIVV